MPTLGGVDYSIILDRLKTESGAEVARSLGVSKQRISEVKAWGAKQAGVGQPEAESASDAAALRRELSRLLPVKQRARAMVNLVKDDSVPASARARMLERIDALCGIHEAPPERESTKPLISIVALPADLTFSR